MATPGNALTLAKIAAEHMRAAQGMENAERRTMLLSRAHTAMGLLTDTYGPTDSSGNIRQHGAARTMLAMRDVERALSVHRNETRAASLTDAINGFGTDLTIAEGLARFAMFVGGWESDEVVAARKAKRAAEIKAAYEAQLRAEGLA